ncbi:MAG: hypothetical protein WB764_08985 [Xanthobacteraceae bacterium]
MKTFRTIVILKRPHVQLWTTMRDHLPEVASRLPEIESVTETERIVGEDGKTHIVNEWLARYPIPAGLSSFIKRGELGWTDRNSWDDGAQVCAWAIFPYLFTEYIHCEGRTVFEPAMAGQGARITLEGKLELKAGFLGIATAAEKLAVPFLEAVVTSAIPRSLRATLEAAAAFEQAPARSAE